MAIKKENKTIQITLDPHCYSLLNTLTKRFNKSKTDIIKEALVKFAARTRTNVVLMYREPKNVDDQVDKDLVDIVKTKRLND